MENKKEIQLPEAGKGKNEADIEETLVELRQEAQQRQQQLLTNDALYRDIIGRISALEWVIKPKEED